MRGNKPVELLKWDRIKSMEFIFMVCPLRSDLYSLELFVIKYLTIVALNQANKFLHSQIRVTIVKLEQNFINYKIVIEYKKAPLT